MSRAATLDGIGLLLRLLLGAVLLVAGWLKVTDLGGSVQSVVAYQLLPYEGSQFVGIVLPVLELALGLLLLLGLLVRPAAIAAGALMLVFVAGIASVWARGLSIDCGCFGSGGPVQPGQTAYLPDLLRDTGLALAGLWLAIRPRTLLSLDSLLWKGPTD